ncbi:SDR family NAD(P)-dependent oxidoreductase [Abyssalbus ytuae]|uniref:SDR family NAD(P)-dependent oxidoreductase n=1 Tax=Abyssalbus ytuae TaxID=2926907 RepID=A0A9E7CUC1_9FLAO|nr:SDR family NAD(P)-dependent oxidoreductase [Abyssalbus ytuae]UOB18147.1 SDR family NAD(P)-dependent oxidoreductase [Abyssalbus ytuae]
MENSKVWYITGASKGLGLSMAKQLLQKGQKVAATSRNINALTQEVGNDYSSSFLPLEVDLTSEYSIKSSIKSTIHKFGKIDVVVNNAGYGTGGALEELTGDEIQKSFEVNFFAVIKVIQQALPYMRKEKSGHIINISSIAGFAPGTGWCVYGAAKSAINGLSEGLANELKPLGIKVSIVSPGWFRTSFAKEESIELSKKEIPDYEHIRAAHKKFKSTDGKQTGNPNKVADVLLRLVNETNPPINLFLGSDAYDRATYKTDSLTRTIKEWKEISFSTDF